MNAELNEAVARAIGWYLSPCFGWLNYWGASVKVLPDFSGNQYAADTVVRAFESSLQTQMDGTAEAFTTEYRHDMTPIEICQLALKVAADRDRRDLARRLNE